MHANPSRWWVEIHGLPEPIVTVRLRARRPADPPSDYWGWLKADEPNCYLFVWPSEMQFDMRFPSGPEAEEKRGRGRKVNLVLEDIAPAEALNTDTETKK